ncbi:uncharacterized protein LOC126184286 [Schistocerca cancellata]|uniref:uncharacterized protein LOC126184286 n=1 Tax=Schistocerca cancellata TaxID=274614 RepID=UPI0021177BA4|nr:uncharacterized protein LOC126184286 [Schistocerca cancellata]
MDASHWVVAFLLFTASQGTQQRLIVDDNAPLFDDFPGYRSTDDVSKDVPPRNRDDTSTTAPEALVESTGALRSMEEHDATSLLLPGRVDVTTRRSNVNVSLSAITTANPPEDDNHGHFSIHLYIHQIISVILACGLGVFLLFLLVKCVKQLLRCIQRNRTPELQRFPLSLQELIARDTQQPYSTEP